MIFYKNRSILLQACPIIIFSALYLYYGFIINDNFYIFPDSHRYLETGYRWDGYSFLPNLNRLLGDDAQSLAFCLVCLSYISWVSLMVILTLWLRIPWLSFSVVSLIGFIALSARVNQWTHMILSEAPTIFFGILALAFSFKVWAQPWPKEKSSQRFFSGVWFCCFCFAVTCWVFSHPSLFVVALPLTAITTGRFFYHAPVMRCIAPLCFSLLTILPTPLSVGENEWQGPFLHSYCMRVSTDPAFLEAFRDAGMAEPLAPISCAGKWGFDKIFPIYQHPENSAWRQWVDEHGIKTYWMTLFTHPKIFFTPLWKAFDVIYLQQSEALELNRLGPPMAFYRTHHLSPDKPDYQPALQALDPLTDMPPGLLLLWIAIVLGHALHHRLKIGILWLPFCLAASSFGYGLLLYFADGAEIPRHTLPAGVLLQISLLVYLAGLWRSLQKS